MVLPLFFGGTYHAVLQTYFEAKMNNTNMSIDDVISIFNNMWSTQQFAEGKQVLFDKDPNMMEEQGKLCLQAYWPIFSKIQPAMIEQVLEKFLIPNELQYYGRLDLITSEGVFVDFKTAARLPYEPEVVNDPQLTGYSFLAGGPTKAQFHYVTKEKFPKVRVFQVDKTQKHIDSFITMVIGWYDTTIKVNKFPPNITRFCNWCDCAVKCGLVDLEERNTK